MSLAKRVLEVVEKMERKDYEGALIPASIVLDATASKEYPQCRNNEAYKAFITANSPLITALFTGGLAINGQIWLRYRHTSIYANTNGQCSLDAILYHAVRCSLLHKGQLPPNILIAEENIIAGGYGEIDTVTIPSKLIYGMTIASMASPVNANEPTPIDAPSFLVRDTTIPFGEIWGARHRLQRIFGLSREDSSSDAVI